MSFTSIFAVAIGDDWNYLMTMAFRVEGYSALLFYPIVFVVMNLVLLNLFLAILLHNFAGSGQEADAVTQEEEKNLAKFKRKMRTKCRSCNNRMRRWFSCCYVKEIDADGEKLWWGDQNLSLIDLFKRHGPTDIKTCNTGNTSVMANKLNPPSSSESSDSLLSDGSLLKDPPPAVIIECDASDH